VLSYCDTKCTVEASHGHRILGLHGYIVDKLVREIQRFRSRTCIYIFLMLDSFEMNLPMGKLCRFAHAITTCLLAIFDRVWDLRNFANG